MIKKLLIVLILTLSTTTYAQKEKISFNKTTAEANTNILATIENYDKNSTYILNIETADDLMVLDSSLISDDGKFNFYIEKVGKHIGTFKKLNSKTGNRDFLENVILTITPKITTLKITNIKVNGFNQTKENYKAWDNAMSSYLPDVYFEVRKNDKLIFKSNKQSNRKPDIAFAWNVNQISWRKHTPQDTNDTFKILFYDEDSVSDHDFMGGFQFSRAKFSSYFPLEKTKTTMTYKNTNLVVEIDYKWVSEL